MLTKLNRPFLMLVCILIIGLMASCTANTATNKSSTTNAPAQALLETPLASLPPAPSVTPTLAPTPSEEEIRSAIVNALLALYVQTNRMSVTTDLGNGEVRSNLIEFIPPDRKHIVDLDGGLEYLVIGEVVYTKTSQSGEWEETNIPASSFLGDSVVTAETIAATVSNAQQVRKDMFGGIPVIIYNYDSLTHSSDIELHSRNELWVGEGDGLPYQMVMHGEILSAATDPQTGENKFAAVQALTTTLIEFDPSISIGAPVE